VREPGVARKYALALFRAAQEKGRLDAVEADLAAARGLLVMYPRVAHLLGAPEVPEHRKRAFLNGLLTGRVEPLILELLELLLQKGRFPFFGEVIDQFQALAMEARGIVRVKATTAVGLGQAERAKLVEKLHRLTGKTVQMTEQVDPRILGGVVVQLGGKIIDGSVKTALSELRESLLSAPLSGS